MPLPVVPDHYLVSARFQRAGEDDVVNTFCFRNDSTDRDPLIVAGYLRGILDEFYGPGGTAPNTVGQYLADPLHSLVYVAYDLGEPNAGAVELPSLTFRNAPASTGSQLPPDVCITVSWQTAYRGPSFRGRTYLGPVKVNSMADPGLISGPCRTAIANAAAKLIGNPLTRKASIQVLSREHSRTTAVTRGYIDAEYDTQRRRGYRSTQRTPFVSP